MRKSRIAVLASTTLILAACGGGSNGGSESPILTAPVEIIDVDQETILPVKTTPEVISEPTIHPPSVPTVIVEEEPLATEESVIITEPIPVSIIEEPTLPPMVVEPEPEPVVILEPVVIETFYKISQIDNDLDVDGEIDITREQTTFDDRGNVISKTYRDKYGDPEAIGNTSTYIYNENNQVLTYTHATRSHGTYTYDSVGNLICWTDNSYFTSYGYMTYDADNNLIENWYFTNDRESHYGYNTMSTYTYENTNIVTATTDNFSGNEPNGIDDEWEYDYDIDGNQIYQSQILQNGKEIVNYSSSTYEENHILAHEHSTGSSTIYAYDDNWNLLLQTSFQDNVQTSQTVRTYDINDNMLSVVGQNNYERYWTYDENSNMLSRKIPWMNGDIKTWHINIYTYENNNMTSDSSDRDSDGISEFMTRYTYDINNNQLSQSWARGDEAGLHQVEYYTWQTFTKQIETKVKDYFKN